MRQLLALESHVLESLAKLQRNSSRLRVSVLFTLGALLLLGVELGACFFTLYSASGEAWDDALMWQRYANNILQGDGIVWNPGQPATYGLTSLAFLAVSIPAHLLMPHHASAAAVLSSLTSGAVLLCLLFALAYFSLRQQGVIGWLGTALILAPLAGDRDFFVHFLSGMDTCFVMAFLAGYILFASFCAARPSWTACGTLGIVSALAFWVRPDLLIFTLPALAGVGSSRGSGVAGRKRRIVLTSAFLGSLSLEAAFNVFYFHSLLPLPFYAKSTHLYGPTIYGVYRTVNAEQLKAFTDVTAPWMVAGTLGVLWRFTRHRACDSLPWLDLVLLMAAILHLLYFRYAVLQIMYYNARFYYPALPAWVYLSARTLADAWQELSTSRIAVHGRKTLESDAGLGGTKILLAGGIFFLFFAGWQRVEAWRFSEFLSLKTSDLNYYRQKGKTGWAGLDKVSAISGPLTIATTEVGMVGLLNPNREIFDLAGLNDTQIAHEGFHARQFFAEKSPDLVYLPYPDYAEMIKDIETDPMFHAHYTLYQLRPEAAMDVAVCKSSPFVHPLTSVFKPWKRNNRRLFTFGD